MKRRYHGDMELPRSSITHIYWFDVERPCHGGYTSCLDLVYYTCIWTRLYLAIYLPTCFIKLVSPDVNRRVYFEIMKRIILRWTSYIIKNNYSRYMYDIEIQISCENASRQAIAYNLSNIAVKSLLKICIPLRRSVLYYVNECYMSLWYTGGVLSGNVRTCILIYQRWHLRSYYSHCLLVQNAIIIH